MPTSLLKVIMIVTGPVKKAAYSSLKLTNSTALNKFARLRNPSTNNHSTIRRQLLSFMATLTKLQTRVARKDQCSRPMQQHSTRLQNLNQGRRKCISMRPTSRIPLNSIRARVFSMR